jgi:integrase
MRILDHDEEAALLAACGARTLTYEWAGKTITRVDDGERRRLLAPAIICAIETALRKNEQFTLTRGDVWLVDRVIRVRAYNAKVEKERYVPITDRLHLVIVSLLEQAAPGGDALLFPHVCRRRTFTHARLAAGLTDLRWHDLRHTAIMRMLEYGVPESEVMKITGHTSYVTFMRYVTLNKERMRQVAAMMDARRAQLAEEARRKAEEETVH